MKHRGKPSRKLNVAVTFLEADNTSARRHYGKIPSVDVPAIRQRTGLSQSDFAASIGVPEGTLVNSCAAAEGQMGTGASRSQHHDRGGKVG